MSEPLGHGAADLGKDGGRAQAASGECVRPCPALPEALGGEQAEGRVGRRQQALFCTHVGEGTLHWEAPRKGGCSPTELSVCELVMSDLDTHWAGKDILRLRWVEMAKELWVLKMEASIRE